MDNDSPNTDLPSIDETVSELVDAGVTKLEEGIDFIEQGVKILGSAAHKELKVLVTKYL
jgi:hypothetical protein